MLHVNEKYFDSHNQFLTKNNNLKMQHDVRQLRKNPRISYDPGKLTI